MKAGPAIVRKLMDTESNFPGQTLPWAVAAQLLLCHSGMPRASAHHPLHLACPGSCHCYQHAEQRRYNGTKKRN